MASTYGTQFQESEAILAVSADDFEYAETVLRKMTDDELKELSANAQQIRNMVTDLLWRRREGL